MVLYRAKSKNMGDHATETMRNERFVKELATVNQKLTVVAKKEWIWIDDAGLDMIPLDSPNRERFVELLRRQLPPNPDVIDTEYMKGDLEEWKDNPFVVIKEINLGINLLILFIKAGQDNFAEECLLTHRYLRMYLLDLVRCYEMPFTIHLEEPPKGGGFIPIGIIGREKWEKIARWLANDDSSEEED